MQDMTTNFCDLLPVGTTGTLKDTRDNKVYTVAKIANSKWENVGCWMTQNLALFGDTVLTINDTDLDSNIFTTTEQTYTLPTATNTGGFDNTKLKDSNSTDTYANQQVRNPADPDTNKYGAYYSYCAATAGTCLQGAYADIIPNSSNAGNAGNVANTTVVPANQNATSSICPKGWQLPINGGTTTDKSYSKLLSGLSGSAGSTTMRGAPYNFVYGGGVNGSSLNGAGSGGYYWSSTAISAALAYDLFFGSSLVTPSYSGGRFLGHSVRCVAR